MSRQINAKHLFFKTKLDLLTVLLKLRKTDLIVLFFQESLVFLGKKKVTLPGIVPGSF